MSNIAPQQRPVYIPKYKEDGFDQFDCKPCGTCGDHLDRENFRSKAATKNGKRTITAHCEECREKMNKKRKSSTDDDTDDETDSDENESFVDEDDESISFEEESEDDDSEDDDESDAGSSDDDESEDESDEVQPKKRRRLIKRICDDSDDEEEEEEEPEIFKERNWQFKSMRLSAIEFMEVILDAPDSWSYQKQEKRAFFKKNDMYKIFYFDS